MNNARTACANSHEQRANYEREQRRTHPRTARRARLARGSPRLSMPHSYSIFLVNNKIKVQMGVSSALFLFLCVNWFTACVGGRRLLLLLLLLLLRMAGRPWCRLLPHCTAQTITRIVLAAWKMMSHHQPAQNPATLRPLTPPSPTLQARITDIPLIRGREGGLVFFSFWVLLGSSGVPSGVLLVFFWCSSGVLLVFDNTEEHQKNPEEPRRTPEEHQKRNRRHVRYCRYTNRNDK